MEETRWVEEAGELVQCHPVAKQYWNSLTAVRNVNTVLGSIKEWVLPVCPRVFVTLYRLRYEHAAGGPCLSVSSMAIPFPWKGDTPHHAKVISE